MTPGDVVAFQLPNCVEAGITFYAAALLGVVLVPVVHFYGHRELGYILRQTEAKVLITADRFGHLDYLAGLEQLRPELPALELVAVVPTADGDGRGEPGVPGTRAPSRSTTCASTARPSSPRTPTPTSRP